MKNQKFLKIVNRIVAALIMSAMLTADIAVPVLAAQTDQDSIVQGEAVQGEAVQSETAQSETAQSETVQTPEYGEFDEAGVTYYNEEENSEPSEEPESADFMKFAIKAIPATDKEHSAGVKNTLKLSKVYHLQFEGVDGRELVSYRKEDEASDGDIIIKLSMSASDYEKNVIEFDYYNMNIYAQKAGTVTVKAEAWVKGDVSTIKESTLDVTVVKTRAELIDYREHDDEVYIWFDDVDPDEYYQGWVKKDRYGHFTEADAYGIDGTYYYFASENDINYNKAKGEYPAVDDYRKWQMVKDPFYINGRLYKFEEDEDGFYSCKGSWNRLVDIYFEDIPAEYDHASEVNTLSLGSTYTFTIEYNKAGGNPVEEIGDDKTVTFSSDNKAVRVEKITYEYVKTPESSACIKYAYVTVSAQEVTADKNNNGVYTPVRLTAESGDAINRRSYTKDIYVTYPEGWFKIDSKNYFGQAVDTNPGEANGRSVKLTEGWLSYKNGVYAAVSDPVVGAANYYFYRAADAAAGLGQRYAMANDTVEIGSNVYFFDAYGRMTGFYDRNNLGFVSSNGKMIYYDAAGNMVKDALVSEGGRLYYMSNGTVGEMVKNDWISLTGPFDMYVDGSAESVGTSGEEYIFRAGSDGALLTGRQTINGASYYFADADYSAEYGAQTGSMQTGIVFIKGNYYFFDAASGDVESGLGMLRYGYFENVDDHGVTGKYYSLGAKDSKAGALKNGWQTVSGVKKLFGNSSSSDIYGRFVEIADMTSTGWIEKGSGADYRRIYISGNRTVSKGFKTIDGAKYYFDSDGACLSGLQQIGSRYYFFGTVNNFGGADDDYGRLITGLTDYTPAETYYAESSGALKLGWQKINGVWRYFDRATGAEDKTADTTDPNWFTSHSFSRTYYFRNGTSMATGFATVDGRRFYFNADSKSTEYGCRLTGFFTVSGKRYYGDPVSGELAKGETVISGENYYFGTDYAMKTGWQKINGCYRFFDYKTGCERTVTDEGDNWVSVGGYNYYLKSGTTPVSGIQTINGKKYFFSNNKNDGSLGRLLYGFITSGKNKYYADPSTGELYTGVRVISGDVYCFGTDGVMKTGWQTITSSEGSYKYYFAENGTRQKGFINIKDKKYYLAEASETVDGKLIPEGALRTGYIEAATPAAGSRYYTDSSGVVKTGWQKIKISGVNTWCYFGASSDVNSHGAFYGLQYNSTIGADGWATVDFPENQGIYYFANGSLKKGLTKIKTGSESRMYYFDTVTGEMQTGYVTVGKTTYYVGNNGTEAIAGFDEHQGSFVYHSAKGTLSKGWFTVNKNKYYANPDTGIISTGFWRINGKLYYFDESTVAGEAGVLKTGFFRVADRGQSFYDVNGSNMYYADKNGVISNSGWITVATGTKSDSQRWSYYCAPNRPGNGVTGEMAAGETYIFDDGTVVWESEADSLYRTDNIDNMYNFDKQTGARKKTVLYFFGNYHGESNSAEQTKTLDSLSRYINTDMLYNSTSEDIYYVNSDSSAERGRLHAAGLTSYSASVHFPLAASLSSPDKAEREAYNARLSSDIAHWDEIQGKVVSGADGHIDVYDEEFYAKEVYSNAIDRFGTKNLVVMGASSGAGTALSILLETPADKQPSAAILFSPWLDVSMKNAKAKAMSPSRTGSTDYATLKYWGARYTRDKDYEDKSGIRPYKDIEGAGVAYNFASPVNYPASTYSKLQNVYIYTGSYDCCQPDAVDFAYRAATNGAKIAISSYTGEKHGFMFFANDASAAKTIRQSAWTIMTQQ